jgi:hypothetical protein
MRGIGGSKPNAVAGISPVEGVLSDLCRMHADEFSGDVESRNE